MKTTEERMLSIKDKYAQAMRQEAQRKKNHKIYGRIGAGLLAASFILIFYFLAKLPGFGPQKAWDTAVGPQEPAHQILGRALIEEKNFESIDLPEEIRSHKSQTFYLIRSTTIEHEGLPALEVIYAKRQMVKDPAPDLSDQIREEVVPHFELIVNEEGEFSLNVMAPDLNDRELQSLLEDLKNKSGLELEFQSNLTRK